VTMAFRMWRSILAVVAGYVLAALGIGVLRATTVVLLRHFAADGGDWITLSYRLLKLVYTLASAIAGGYLAAAVADRKPRWHAFAVSAVLAGAFLISHTRYAAQPVWYFNSLVILALVGPMLGGYLEHWRVDRSVENESKAYRAANVLVGGFLIGATLVNRWSPSSELLLPNNAAAGQGMLTVTIVACAVGAWLLHAGLRREQRF
jgi:MFS family permease